MDLIISDKDSDSGDEATPLPRKKALKSRKLQTTDSSVLHKVVWPHEVVYTAMDKPAEYEGLTIPLFVSSYLAVMVVKHSVYPLMIQHLQDLMSDVALSDVELYSLEPVRTFHVIWLQQLEQGRVTWADETAL